MSIFYYSIASGSSGNCSLYIYNDTKILIDLGVSVRKLTMALAKFNIKPDELDAVLLTHEHIDHIKGLSTFTKKFDVPIYASNGTVCASILKAPHADEKMTAYFSGESFKIGELDILSFPTSHDAEESTGYIIAGDEHILGFATDIGFVSKSIQKLLNQCDMVIIEANHDPHMLFSGTYPRPIKMRIAGNQGHLSNEACAVCVAEMVENGVKSIVLAHLSEQNNTPALAVKEVKAELQSRWLTCDIYVAPSDEMQQPIYIKGEEELCLASD